MPTLAECLRRSRLDNPTKAYLRAKARDSDPVSAAEEYLAVVDSNIARMREYRKTLAADEGGYYTRRVSAKPEPEALKDTLSKAGIKLNKTKTGWSVKGISKEQFDGLREDNQGRVGPKGWFLFKQDPTEAIADIAREAAEEAEFDATERAQGRVKTSIGYLEAEEAESFERERADRIKLRREAIEERNESVRELLANTVTSARRGGFKSQLRKAKEANQVPGFDKLVDYSNSHTDLGLPQSEDGLFEMLKNEPFTMPIDEAAIAEEVDAEMDAEVGFVGEAELEEGWEEGWEFPWDREEAVPQQTAIPGTEEAVAEQERREQAQRAKQQFEPIGGKQGAFISGLGTDLPGQEILPGMEDIDVPVTEAEEAAPTAAEIADAIAKEIAGRAPKKRSERAAERREAAKQRFLDAGRRLIDPSDPAMGLNPSKVKDAVDMALAAIDYGAATFDEFVSLAVESFGEQGVRDRAPYLEEAARQTNIENVTSVTEVLDRPPPHPEELATEPPADSDDLTSIKKAIVNELREIVGLPEMEGSTPQSVEQWVEEARTTLNNDPSAGIKLVNELATSPRPISQHDAMLLQFRYRQLANELEPIVDEYFEAVQSQDPVAIAAQRKAVIDARSRMSEFEEIIHPSKETWGRTGVALQQLLKKDFSLEAILRRGQEANHGKPLAAEQTAELTELGKRLESIQKVLDKKSRRVEELEREAESRRQHDEALEENKRRKAQKRSVARAKAEKRVSDAWDALQKRWRGRLGAGPPLESLPQIVELAKAYTELGVVRFGEFMNQVRVKLGRDVDEAVFRQAWDQALSEEEIVVPDLDIGDRAQLTKEARRIQRLLVESGMTKRDDVIDKVHEILSEELPELTRRQAMDALSKYGQFQTQSQEEIDKLIREMNAEILKMSQIDQQEIALRRVDELRAEGKADEEIGDILQREELLVEATGLVRDKPNETLARLTKLYNENKKGIPASTEGRAGLLQTAVAAIERSLTNRIRDLNWEISHGERIVRTKRDRPTSERIKELEVERDALLKVHREMFPPQRKRLSDEQRLSNALKAADRSIKQLEQQLATLNFDRPPGRTPVSSAELQAKRARIEQLRAQRDAAKEMELARWEAEGGAIPPDPKGERARKIYEASLRKRIADYQQILASGDFAPKPKKQPRTLSPSELKLKRQLEDTRHEVLQKYAQYHLDNLRGIPWVADKVSEAAHLSRALMTSFDLSALLRQGGLPALGHPILAQRALVETVASIASSFDKSVAFDTENFKWNEVGKFLTGIDSRQAEFDFMHKLTQGPEGEFRLAAGLSLPSTDEAITRQEEVFQGRWGKLVPGVAVSSRLYTMILNKMRADLFDSMVQHLGRNGQVSLDEAKIIAGFVNVATGRSAPLMVKVGGRLVDATAVLNTTFFAPRYVASRFQYLAMPFYLPFKGGLKKNWQVKRAIYKEYARTVTGIATVLGAVALAAQLFWDEDDEGRPSIEWDNATSSDWLKVRMGDTRLDFLAGLQQVMVLSARMLPERLGGGGTTSTVTGEFRPYGEGYKPTTRATVLERFVRSKMAPVPGTIWTITDDMTNVVGQKETPLSLAASLVSPLSVRDIAKTMEAQGVPMTVALSTLAILGVGMNTYGPKTEYVTGTDTERKDQFEKDLERMMWDSPDPAYSEFLTEDQMEQVRARRKDRQQTVVMNAIKDAKTDKSQEQLETAKQVLKDTGWSHLEAQQQLFNHYMGEPNWEKFKALAELYDLDRTTSRDDLFGEGWEDVDVKSLGDYNTEFGRWFREQQARWLKEREAK